ncbi:hypothetical protein PIB30_016223 [Stylosanthes scabra]|uniref:Uncharacterized protein n=1 Tax=Stylosanthes scabra TaxID=79078 RepID=A0ABU6W5A2_9FABA|nr:hypothetical protein [Stylosanthes scabra]
MLVHRDVGLSMAPLEVFIPFIRDAGFGGPLDMRSMLVEDVLGARPPSVPTGKKEYAGVRTTKFLSNTLGATYI